MLMSVYLLSVPISPLPLPSPPTHTHTVSPHVVVETVRLWLQEDQNNQKFDRIVFCGEDNLPHLEATLQKYFPLLPFVTGIIPEGVEGENPSADELLGGSPW